MGLAGMLIVLALLCLGPNNRAGGVDGLRGGTGVDVPVTPGHRLRLRFPNQRELNRRLLLVVTVQDPAQAGALSLLIGGEAQPPAQLSDQRLYFTCPAGVAAETWLHNHSANQIVRVASYLVRNYHARNANFPRMAILLPGNWDQGSHWQWWRAPLLTLIALALGALALWGAGPPPAWRLWATVAPPAVACLAAAVTAAFGARLLLAYDTYLLLAGVGAFLAMLQRRRQIIGLARRTANLLVRAGRAIGRATKFFTPSSLRGRRLPQLVMLALVLLIVFLPAMLLPSPSVKVPFDRHWLDEINAKQFYVVGIGNSMIGSRIDHRRLSELLGGKPVDVKWFPGTGPRLWYLLLKNYVCQAQPKPKYVIMMFGDNEFPWPRRGFLNDWDIRQVEGMTPDGPERFDPLFQKLCLDNPTPRERLHYALRHWFRVANYAFDLTEGLSDAIMRITEPPQWVLDIEPGLQAVLWRRDVNDRFSLGRLRPGVFNPKPTPPPDPTRAYHDLVNSSFLPEMVRLCKANGVKLIILHWQHRRFNAAHGEKEPPEMKMVVDAVAKYCKENGVLYHDFIYDPKITEDLYGAGDHIGYDHRRTRWTEIMFERIGHFFK